MQRKNSNSIGLRGLGFVGVYKGCDQVGGLGDLVGGGYGRCAVALLLAVHAEVCVATALNYCFLINLYHLLTQ